MGAVLPPIERAVFFDRLRADMQTQPSEAVLERLFVHYEELRRWNRIVSLVGPGTTKGILWRHYRESLVALSFFPEGGGVLVDVGSGGGFPGFVLAAARPDLDVTLVEAREKKAAFLSACCRKAALPCRCLNARVGSNPVVDLPEKIDFVTSRAVSVEDLGLEVLAPRLADDGFVLLWTGAKFVVPEDLQVVQELKIPDSRHRRIVKLVTGRGGP